MRGLIWPAFALVFLACSSFNGADTPTPNDDGGTDGQTPDGQTPVMGVPDDSSLVLRPFTDSLPVTQGQQTKLTVTLMRGLKQVGPVRVELQGARDGIIAESITTTTATGDLQISVPEITAQGNAPAKVVATGMDDSGKPVIATADITLLVRGLPGTLDTTWGPAGDGILRGVFGTNTAYTVDIAIAADDSIFLLATDNTSTAGATLVAHLDADGKLDTTYGDNGYARIATILRPSRIVLQPDGLVLVAGRSDAGLGRVGRLTKQGALDSAFGGGVVTLSSGTLGGSAAVAVDVDVRASDGAVYVAFQNTNGAASQNGLAALTSSGSVRSGFGSSGAVGMGALGGGASVVVRNNSTSLSKGNVALIWNAQPAGMSGSHGFFQFNGDTGLVDAREGASPRVVSVTQPLQGFASARVELPDESVIAPILDFNHSLRLYKHDALGGPAPGFGPTSDAFSVPIGNGFSYGIALANDGKIVVAGGSSDAKVTRLVRVTPAGALDPAFGVGGTVEMTAAYSQETGLGIQKKTGRIVIGVGSATVPEGLAAFWP